jgi:hypothetical protein
MRLAITVASAALFASLCLGPQSQAADRATVYQHAGLGPSGKPSIAVIPPQPQTIDELKELRLKQLFRRVPRAKEAVEKVAEKIRQSYSTSDSREMACTQRLERLFYQLVMATGTLSEDRLNEAADLLSDLAGPYKQPSEAELEQLRERYKKVCAQLDDLIFVKDLEPALHAHDRLIVRTAVGIWDRNKIEAELQKLAESIPKAPDIPYGRSELLRNLEGKRLLPPVKGGYIGISTDGAWLGENLFVSTDRPSVGILEEATGSAMQLESISLPVQSSDGNPIDLEQADRPWTDFPFSPPISLWMKTRLLEGHVPVVCFNLLDRQPSPNYNSYSPCYQPGLGKPPHPVGAYDRGPKVGNDASKIQSIQDVLDGKLDDYFRHNFQLIAAMKAPVLVCLFDGFDQSAAASAFGSDGRTPYYLLVDPKLTKLPAEKLTAEVLQKLSKGTLVKDIGAELRNQYGDPSVPDGPERVRDAWKRIHGIATASGATNVSLAACAGALHGNKKALAGQPLAGAQDWNKLEFYWPGEGVLDWFGITDVWADAGKVKGTFSFADCLDGFIQEVRNSNWRSTPLIVHDIAPAREDPLNEDKWINAWFSELLPASFPELRACLVSFPEALTLWAPDGFGAFRRSVTSNPYFKQKARLVPAKQQQASSSQ